MKLDLERMVVLQEERALELTMAQPDDLSRHEHEVTKAEVRSLRTKLYSIKEDWAEDMIRRLDAVTVELLCIQQKWAESGVLTRNSTPEAA